MAIVYVPVVAVLSAIFLVFCMLILVGWGTSKASVIAWLPAWRRKEAYRMRKAAGLIVILVLASPFIPLYLLRSACLGVVKFLDWACEGRRITVWLTTKMDAVEDWILSGRSNLGRK